MSLDSVSNFGRAFILGGLTSSGTSVELRTGDVSNLPVSGNFNCVIFNASDYVNPIDDPFKEIVRVNSISGSFLSVSRAQEGTTAASHSMTGKTYVAVNTITKKMIDDINSAILSYSPTTVNADTIYVKNIFNSGTSALNISGSSIVNINASGAGLFASQTAVTLASPSIDLFATGGGSIATQGSIIPVTSGTYNIGSAAYPVGTVYTNAIIVSGTAGGGSSFAGGAVTSSITPTISGTLTLGTAALPFSGTYSNQYETTLVSGTGGNTTLNWNLGTSQILNFNGVASGTYTIGFSNGIPGSTYVLQTIQNASGTASIAWSGTQTLWQAGVSGTMTATSGTSDLFAFFYNGSKYFSNSSNNYR